ncbi:MAG: succinylglutamate desuccinylase/aspartoacylase family protein [Oceanicoccus sp.]
MTRSNQYSLVAVVGLSLLLAVLTLGLGSLSIAGDLQEDLLVEAEVSETEIATDTESPQTDTVITSAVAPVTMSSTETSAEPVAEPTPVVTDSVATSTEILSQNNAKKISDPTKQKIIKRPQAKSVQLNEPVTPPEPLLRENVLAPVVELAPEAELPSEPQGDTQLQAQPLVILDTEVLPGTSTRLSWSPRQSFEGIATPTPVLIVHGAKPGPVLCLTAAIHGDELNGIEIVRRTLYDLKPEQLAGTVIGVPIVNLQGFRLSSRYLTDRRDLNRSFPGNPDGSSASRIAHSFFNELITHCDALIDLHTGSFHRTNLPQLRADITNPKVVELTQGFGSTVVLQSEGALGTLRRAAVDVGIPAVTLEAGESMRLQSDAVKHGVKGIQTLMSQMDMIETFSLWGDPEPVYYNSVWVRASRGGILFSDVALGDHVDVDDLLGVVTDPITNIKTEIKSPNDGRVIGMALNQVVLPGFAAFHIGIRAPDETPSNPQNNEELQQEGIDGQASLAEESLEPLLEDNPGGVVTKVVGDSQVRAEGRTEATVTVVDEMGDTEDEGMDSAQSEVDEFD